MSISLKDLEIYKELNERSIKTFLKEYGLNFEDFLSYPTSMAVTRNAFRGHMVTIEKNNGLDPDLKSALVMRHKFFYKEKLKKYLQLKVDQISSFNISSFFQ